VDSLDFKLKVDNTAAFAGTRVQVRDGGTWCKADVLNSGLVDGAWTDISLPRTSFTCSNWTNVKQIGFQFINTYGTTDVSIDDIKFVSTGPPPEASNVIGDNETFGFYVSGHGTFINCTWCHDSTKDHITAVPRLPVFDYIQSVTNPTGFRFYDEDAMGMQLPYNNYKEGPTGAFALCYQCHDEACITQDDIEENLETNFRDEGPIFAGPENLHLYHVGAPGTPLTPTVYHGTCVLCHDPMAPTNAAMTRREMGNFIYFDENGCQLPREDWKNEVLNVGGAQTEGSATYMPLCTVCHTIGVPPNPDCGGSNPYNPSQMGMNGYYYRSLKGACLVAAGASHTTHIDALKGPMVGDDGCDICHASSFDLSTLVANGVCDSCHSPGGVYNGVSDAVIGAANNWDDGVYESDGKTLKAGKEKWCVGCHDNAPAYSKQTPIEIIVDNQDAGASFTGAWLTSTFAPGFYGPDYHYHVSGAGSDTFTWTPTISTAGPYTVYGRWTQDPSRAPDATYKIYHDGPGSPTDVVVDQRANGGAWVALGTFEFDGSGDFVQLAQKASGYVIADAIKFESGGPATFAPNIAGDGSTYGFYVRGHGKNNNGIECLDCHDASKGHIDGEHRTYSVDEVTYFADADYTDSYRLRNIGGQPALNLPRGLYPPATNPLVFSEDFALCFDCHNRFEVMTQTGLPGKSNFWNNDTSPGNSHNIHLGIYTRHFDSDWDGVADSSESCIACHNVHGPPNQSGIRHGELISSPGTTNKAPALNFAYLLPPSPGTRDTSITVDASIGGSMNFAGPFISQNAVCNACHGGLNYLRPAYTGPRVLYPQANPGTVDIGAGAQNVELTVFVTDPDDAIPGGVSVSVNLSPIGGGTPSMSFQAGTTNVYAYTATIPASTDPGQYSFVVTASDGGMNSGQNTIVLRVTKPGVEIVDNTDAGATPSGTWGVSTSISGFFGPNYAYHLAGAGPDIFTWTPTVTSTATYKIYARWTQDPSRAPDATYTIYHDGGTTPVPVDQRSNGGAWVQLGGTFSLDGTNDKVVLSQNPSGYVVADAIRFDKQ
jgi:hypothetical protein